MISAPLPVSGAPWNDSMEMAHARQRVRFAASRQIQARTRSRLRNSQGTLIWSARVSLDLRAVGHRTGDVITWVWIGTHNEFDNLFG